MNYLEKEYHPIIEDYVAEYVEDNLDKVERDAFEEVLVQDDDLRELAFSAKEGRKYLQMLQKEKATEGLLNRLHKRLEENN